ncbi:MAG: hypothetical protein WB697_03535 [Stellaceae bacterium]
MRSDVDPVAEDVVLIDNDVAEIDADTELDPSLGRHFRLALSHSGLHLQADCTASTTRANSISNPSPVVLTMRPL